MDFPARRKSSAGKLIFCKFCVYFPSRMRGTCVSVSSVLRGMRATPGDGVWKLRVRYRQHTCTAKYGHVNSVVNVRELRARCEGTWTYKNERFSQYWRTIYQYWEIKMINRYCKNLYGFTDVIFILLKLFTDIRNYFPISVIISLSREILDKYPFDVPGPLYWRGLTLIPAWISNHMSGKMWDEIA